MVQEKLFKAQLLNALMYPRLPTFGTIRKIKTSSFGSIALFSCNNFVYHSIQQSVILQCFAFNFHL